MYKEPLEKAVADGKPLLASEDIRSIFGGIREIANLHSHLHHDVSEIIDNWEEDCCIADVIKKYKEQLIEVSKFCSVFGIISSEFLQYSEIIIRLEF